VFSTILSSVAGELWDFDDGGARDDDGTKDASTFWPGEAEGREIAGCGDLIGD
jgi:hypothetical protein